MKIKFFLVFLFLTLVLGNHSLYVSKYQKMLRDKDLELIQNQFFQVSKVTHKFLQEFLDLSKKQLTVKLLLILTWEVVQLRNMEKLQQNNLLIKYILVQIRIRKRGFTLFLIEILYSFIFFGVWGLGFGVWGLGSFNIVVFIII